MPGYDTILDSLDGVPEAVAELYTEKNGKFELTGFRGVRTQADLDRVQEGKRAEVEAHNATRASLEAWTPLGESPAEVQKLLDRIPDLETAAEGKWDETKVEEMAQRRAEGMVRSQVLPVERQRDQLKGENEELREKVKGLEAAAALRVVHDAIEAEAAVLADGAILDAKDYFGRVMEVGEDGVPVTRDGSGLTPGLTAKSAMEEVLESGRRPHWFKETRGGGSQGGDGPGPVGNPWTHDGWSMKAQGEYLRKHGREKAAAAAKAAGTSLDRPVQPPAKG